MVPVYRAGRQAIKVRFLMALSLVVLALCLWWGIDLTSLVARVPGALHPSNVYQPLGGSDRGYEPLRTARVTAMRPLRATTGGSSFQ